MSKTIANIGATTSITTGFWSWIDANAGALSVIIAFISALIALTFYILNYIENRKRNREEHEVRMLEKLSIVRSMGLSVDDVINNPELLRDAKRLDRRKAKQPPDD